MAFDESLNVSTVLQYRKIKVSSKDEAKMLDVLLSTSQQFKAISKDEYFITEKQCALLTKKIFRIKRYNEINQKGQTSLQVTKIS